MNKFFALILLIAAIPSWAHNGHMHSGSHHMKMPVPTMSPEAKAYEEINQEYQSKIEPIFKKSCFDCHSQNPKLPWYSSLPGVHQLLEQDRSEAKEHIDMSSGFPFQGHGSPAEDLEALQDSIVKDTMPPVRYRLLHWNSSLTEQEKSTVSDWIEKSQKILQNTSQQ